MYHIRYTDGGEEETVGASCIRSATGVEGLANNGCENKAEVEGTRKADSVCPEESGSEAMEASESPRSKDIRDTDVLSATVFSAKAGYFTEGEPYKHRVGIGADNTPILEMYEVLAALGKLYTCIARNNKCVPMGTKGDLSEIGFRIEEEEDEDCENDTDDGAVIEEGSAATLLKLACTYYNEASECALSAGKTAIAMKYVEEVSALEM